MSESWKNKKVLVSGAGGFIGSHLVETLVKDGAQVRAFVRYNSRNDIGLLRFLPKPILDSVELKLGDLRDADAVREAVRGVDYIFHLGALIAIPYSYLHPRDVVESNVIGTLNVLMAARDAGVERMIHTSTSEVYGTALQIPIDERHPLQGQSPYSASKIGADKLVESFYLSYNLPVTTLRPFNTFGPRQSARAVIPAIITQVLTQEKIHIGNLDARRDFTYVSDTVNGFLKIAQAINVDGQVFNLGTGNEVSIGDLVKQIVSLSGRQVGIQVDSDRLRPEKSEVQRLLSNNQLALERFGWSPQVGLDDGLQLTMDWIRDHLDLYRSGEYVV